MPDRVKEKLVELLDETFDKQYDRNLVITARNTANDLIANGVTVQVLDGCEYCRGAIYTENKFKVVTQMGREVSVQFNFCPKCGRKLPEPPKEVQ